LFTKGNTCFKEKRRDEDNVFKKIVARKILSHHNQKKGNKKEKNKNLKVT